MNVGIIGSGGREHAICYMLNKSKKVSKIFCFPGNAGTAEIAENINIDVNNFKKLKEFINNWDNKSNLVLVTHYVVILELLGVGAESGEVIISNKNYEIVDRIKIN